MTGERAISWLAFLLAVVALALLCVGAIYYQGQLGYYRAKNEELQRTVSDCRAEQSALRTDVGIWQAYVIKLHTRMLESKAADIPPLPEPPRGAKRN